MSTGRITASLGVLLAICSGPVWAAGAKPGGSLIVVPIPTTETQIGWFLDPVAQNWTCAVAPGKASPATCRNYAPAYNAFISAEPVKVTKAGVGSLYYFYVGTWGQISGPTSECVGDGIGIFETPYSASGAKGTASVIYRGSARPCDGSYWYISSAFYDPYRQSVNVTGERWLPGSGDPFKHLYVLTSPDSAGYQDGLNFTQTRIVSSGLSNLNLHGLRVKPSPTQNNVWWGFMVYDNTQDPWWLASTKVEINWNTNTVRYLTGASTWTTIAIGGTITVAPYATFSTAVTSFGKSAGRWEAVVEGDGVSQIVPRSGVTPCGSPTPALYTQNVSGLFDPAHPTSPRWNRGSAARIYVVDTSFNVGGIVMYQSTVRPLPADYGWELGNLTRADTAAGWSAYSGSQSGTICSYDLVDYPFYWSGSGIRWTGVTWSW